MADSIIANFGMDNSRFKKGMRENKKELNGFGKSVGKVKNMLGGMFAGLGVGMALRGIKGMVAELDNLGKASDRIGFTSDVLQSLRFAAEQSGGSISGLDNALERFNNTLGEARNGTGEGVKMFKRLGIELYDTEGIARSNLDVFNDLADKMGSIVDPTEKATISNDAFGRSAGFMATMTKDGTEGLKEYREELEEINGIYDSGDIKKAEFITDQMNKGWIAVKGTAIKATFAVLDYYDTVNKGFDDVNKDGFFISKEQAEEAKKLREEEAAAIEEVAKAEEKSKAQQIADAERLKVANEAIEKGREIAAKKREKYLKDLSRAEEKLSTAIEKYAFDQMDITEKKIFLEKQLAKAREKANSSTGLTSVNARLEELELTKELLKAEEEITKEIKKREEEKLAAEEELKNAIQSQNIARIDVAKQAREETKAAVEKAKAEQESLKSLQAQAVARAASAGGKDASKASKVVELRDKAQKLEDQGKFKKAAEVSLKADDLEADVTKQRKDRLFEQARDALKSGDTETLEKLRGQAERAGYIDSEGRNSDRSVGAQTKDALANEETKLREFAQKQAEELTDIKGEVIKLSKALAEAINDV